MSKRKDPKAKKKLEIKRETLRTMDLKPEQLQQVNGGIITGTDPPYTAPSRATC